MAHLYYYFTEFEIPYNNKIKIAKSDVLRALEEGILPNNLSSGDVGTIFT